VLVYGDPSVTLFDKVKPLKEDLDGLLAVIVLLPFRSPLLPDDCKSADIGSSARRTCGLFLTGSTPSWWRS
jgi:hypothetical protein